MSLLTARPSISSVARSHTVLMTAISTTSHRDGTPWPHNTLTRPIVRRLHQKQLHLHPTFLTTDWCPAGTAVCSGDEVSHWPVPSSPATSMSLSVNVRRAQSAIGECFRDEHASNMQRLSRIVLPVCHKKHIPRCTSHFSSPSCRTGQLVYLLVCPATRTLTLLETAEDPGR